MIESESIEVLKSTTCKTLSGRSTLIYHLGLDPDSEIHVRLWGNNGGGFFSNEWVAWKDIQRVLDKCPKGKPITSFVLSSLFKGKSVNTPAFLLSALINEKLLRPVKGKKRLHDILDSKNFLSRVDELMSSKAPTKTGGNTAGRTAGKTVGKTVKKKVAKKKAVTRKASASK